MRSFRIYTLCLTAALGISPAFADLAAEQPESPTLKDCRATFPHLVFEDDFEDHANGDYPDGWKLRAMVLHAHAQVENGALKVMTGKNIHLIAPCEYEDFLLTFRVRGHHNFPNKLFGVLLHFRLPPGRGDGYYIFHMFGKNPELLAARGYELGGPHSRTTLHGPRSLQIPNQSAFYALSNAKRNEIAGIDLFDNRVYHDVSLAVMGRRVLLFHDGYLFGDFTLPEGEVAGRRFGLSMVGSGLTQPGPMFIDDVNVYATAPLIDKEVLTLRNISIPEKYNRVNGGKMFYDVKISRYGRAWKLWGKVRGGGVESGVSHITEHPYVRLETQDGRHSIRLPLFRGTLGAGLGRRGPQSAPYGPADHSGPVENECYFDFDPANTRIAVGYEYYTIPPRYQDGPCEVMVDAQTGKVLSEGPPMRNGARLTMQSPPEKPGLLNRVSEGNHFRDGFKKFLADNHFLIEDEELRFRAHLLLSHSDTRRSYRCRYQVLDAYKDPVDPGNSWDLKASEGTLADDRRDAGLVTFDSGWQVLRPREPGVYHLRLEARDDLGKSLAVLTKAFSVLPVEIDMSVTPAERSGLPTFFGGSPYPFSAAYQVDTYHYASWSSEWAHRPDATEIKHALNQRVNFSRVDLTTPEGIAVAKQYRDWYQMLSHPDLPSEFRFLNSPRIYNKASRSVKDFVSGFLASEDYVPDPKHPLGVTADEVADLDHAAYTALHDAIKAHYWKAFTGYVADFKAVKVKAARAFMVQTLGEDNAPVSNYAYPLPVNQDYMTPYDAMNSAGINLKRDGWFRDFAVMEAYWPECHYPSDRDWACWAMMKMVAPQTYLLWDLEGDVNAFGDGNCALGWPPWGAMDVASGFFKKAMISYVYGPMHVRDGNVVWSWDGGMRLGYLQPERIQEVLAGFRIRHRHEPKTPVRTVGYLYAQDWIAQHPERLDPAGYPFNTASECIVFAYEEGSRAGVLNGFFCQPEDLAKLDTDSINTLVLPPLTYAPVDVVERIRALYDQGVNLVCFEDPGPLAPLFGVRHIDESRRIDAIGIGTNDIARRELYGLRQARIEHAGWMRDLVFELDGGVALLGCMDDGGKTIGPALVLKEGEKADSLFWTVSPTDISRSLNHQSMRLRGECDSELIRVSMGRGLKAVADTPVSTTAGHLLGFRDSAGRLIVIVYENAYPFPSQPLHPLVRVELPGVGNKTLTSDWPHEIGRRGNDSLSFHFDLDEHDVALFIFE